MSPVRRCERADRRSRGASRRLLAWTGGARAGVRPEQRLVGAAPRRGSQLLPAAARRHRRRVVVGPHQPVRLPAGPRGRSVRRRARRQGGRGRPGPADRRPAGLRSGARLEGALRPVDGGGCRGVREPRHAAARAARAARWRRGDGLEPARAGAYRPSQGRRRRRADRLGRRRRDRGSLRERRVPRPVRPRRGPGRRAAAARVRRQPALARRRDPRERGPGAVPDARRRREPRACGRAPQRAGPLPADHGRDRGADRRGAGRRSTSSTPTSPTAA